MRISRTLSSTLALGATAGLMAIGLGSASAHVSATPTDTAAGASSLVTFAVGHGCKGSPTTSVRITLPAELNSVTPTVNPGWTISEQTETFATPKTLPDGSKITHRTSSVTYTAKTPLPDHHRDTFTLSLKVPQAAGKTLYFPTLQKCEKGQTDWKEVPAAGQDPETLDAPAPSLAVTAAVAGSDSHGHDHGAMTAETEAADVVTHDAGTSWAAWLGLGAGLAGLVLGSVALLRTGRSKAGAAK